MDFNSGTIYIYVIWFHINKFLVLAMQQHISPALGAIYGMLLLEGHTICKAAWYTWNKYRKDPQLYGLNQWNTKNCRNRPVLLLHGAAGSWSYLGDLAVTLKNANIPLFVVDLGMGLPSQEMRRKVFNKIEEIRRLYSIFNQKINGECDDIQFGEQNLNTVSEETSTVKLIRTNRENETVSTTTDPTNSNAIPLVDIVAHSNGGNVALYSIFTEDCSSINGQGELQFRCTRQANPHIGKVITVALPSDQTETKWMREVKKINDLFNVNAKYDALMAYKKCAMVEEFPSHVEYVDAGHIGIVYNRETSSRILQFLLK